jgi:hypothetical protein
LFFFICLCDEIDGIDERDKIDLIIGSEDGRGRAWTGPILTNLIIAREKDASQMGDLMDNKY